MYKRIIFAYIIISALIIEINSQNIWQPLNGPPGGLISQLSLKQNGDVFATTYGAGIFRSTNNGNSWTQIINGLPGPIFDDGLVTLAFSPNGNIYTTFFTKGIYKSTDNGNSWNPSGLQNSFFTAITVAPNGYIYIGTVSGGGIYRSTNEGQSWQQINNGFTSFRINAFAVKPGGEIFAGGQSTLQNEFSVYKTTNNGDNWIAANLTGTDINSLVIAPNGNVFGSSHLNGVFRSTDNGNSWAQVNNGLQTQEINSLYCNSLGNIFASSESGLYRSTNNGGNWSVIGFSGKRVASSVNTQNGSYLAGMFTEGLYSSTNNGASWIESGNGLNANMIYAIGMNSSGLMLAGTGLNGMFRSTDNGASWLRANNGVTGTYFSAINFLTSNNVLCSSDSGVFRSTNSGGNWTKVLAFRFNTFLMVPNGNIFGAGTYPAFGIWLSTNSGLNWNLISTEISSSSLAFNQSGHLFASTSGSGIYKSTNNGVNWIQYGPSGTVSSVAVASNGYVYGAFTSVSQGSEGIYRSTNAGINWQYTGLDNRFIVSLKINSAGYIYAGSFGGGVYRSTNNGSSWDSIGSGIYNNLTVTLALDQAGYLFAGTYGGGIYKTVNSTIGIQQISSEVPVRFELLQNYPNPFNPFTKFKFQIPKPEHIKLIIYDIRGKQIAELLNQLLTAGTYEAEFDGTNLASGVYFYKLLSNDFNKTRKMILVK